MRDKLRQLRENESGMADMLWSIFFIPLAIALTLIVVLGVLIRQYTQAPMQPTLNTYTQMFASAGGNDLPLYVTGKTGVTVEGLAVQAFIDTGLVKDNDEKNVKVWCGPLKADGSIDVNETTINRDSPVGCAAEVRLVSTGAWKILNALTGNPDAGEGTWADRVIGGAWVGRSTAYTERGTNPNVN